MFDLKVRLCCSLDPLVSLLPHGSFSGCGFSRFLLGLTSLASGLQGKAKYKAWEKEVQAGLSASDAEKRYIELVESLKGKYGFDPSKAPEAVGGN